MIPGNGKQEADRCSSQLMQIAEARNELLAGALRGSWRVTGNSSVMHFSGWGRVGDHPSQPHAMSWRRSNVNRGPFSSFLQEKSLRMTCVTWADHHLQGGNEEKSHSAARGGSGSPGPLEVEATEVAGDVDHFSHQIDPGET